MSGVPKIEIAESVEELKSKHETAKNWFEICQSPKFILTENQSSRNN